MDGSGFCSGLACLSWLLLVGAEGGTGNIYLGSHYRCDSDLCRLIDGSPAGTEKTSDRGIASDVCHTDRSLRLRNFWPVHERHGEPERLLQ